MADLRPFSKPDLTAKYAAGSHRSCILGHAYDLCVRCILLHSEFSMYCNLPGMFKVFHVQYQRVMSEPPKQFMNLPKKAEMCTTLGPASPFTFEVHVDTTDRATVVQMGITQLVYTWTSLLALSLRFHCCHVRETLA